MLYDEMLALRREFADTPEAAHFKQPMFHIMVLFVDEAESVARQMKRGRDVKAHNEEVRRSGMGELKEERATDFDEALARNRYRVFKEKTYDALVSLKEIFHYHFINAQAPLESVQRNIVRELEYQSSLELDPRTFDRLRNLPLASEIIRHARQDLVRRLDGYQIECPELLQRVIEFIEQKMMPIVRRHALSGRADINSEDPLFDDPKALVVLIDVFSERGYHPTRGFASCGDSRPGGSENGRDPLPAEEGFPLRHQLQGIADPARIDDHGRQVGPIISLLD